MVADAEREQFLTYLRDRGMRVTRERLALFDEIYRQHGHIDAEAILAGLVEGGHRVSRATVYRNLDLLVEAGLVLRHRLGSRRFLYEHVHAGQQHDHLACRRCGRVVEFVSPSIQAMLGEITRAHGFSRTDRQLQILSLCVECEVAARSEAADEAAAVRAGSERRSEARARVAEGAKRASGGGVR